MLTFENHCKKAMTLAKTGTEVLSQEEWDELNALKEAINYDPHTVTPQKMEKFSELLVRSLLGKGDPMTTQLSPTNY